jgi:hypothetical protein
MHPICRKRNSTAAAVYYAAMRGEIRHGYPIANCTEVWAKHRLYTRLTWALFIGWIPYGALVIEVFYVLLRQSSFVIPAIVPYALALIIVSNIVSMFRCPRCGSRFYAWGPFGLGHNGFARKCRDCGLRKWQCDPPA